MKLLVSIVFVLVFVIQNTVMIFLTAALGHTFYLEGGSCESILNWIIFTQLKIFLLFVLASQCWCLLRIFPMLVGESIPENEPAWNLYLLFLKIVDMCCTPIISLVTVLDLEMSLQCFFNEFRTVYPEETITPKMHNILMYPRLIRKVDPLTQYSCMRFEAKHKYMKKAVTLRNNYKNVAKTIATTHQVELAAVATSKDIFASTISHKSTGISVSAVELFLPYNLPLNYHNKVFQKVSSAVVDGIVYTNNHVLCVAVSVDLVDDFQAIIVGYK